MNTEYKIETHLHTEESNHCSEVPAADMVKHYKEAGYTTVIVTPHYSRAYLSTITSDWDIRIDYLLVGYDKAKKIGEQIGLNILLGLEITLVENKHDYLIYGMTEEFLRTNTSLYDLSVKELVKLCEVNDFLLVQAHPFRKGQEPADIKYKMPIEVFNGRHVLDPQNGTAQKYAEFYDLIGISGTDFHDFQDHKGGIVTNTEIKTIEDFKEAVRNREFKLIISN